MFSYNLNNIKWNLQLLDIRQYLHIRNINIQNIEKYDQEKNEKPFETQKTRTGREL